MSGFREVEIWDGATVGQPEGQGLDNETPAGRGQPSCDGLTRQLPSILEKQLQKSLEIVIWDGEKCALGSLSANERMSLTLNEDGVLEGGYRF